MLFLRASNAQPFEVMEKLINTAYHDLMNDQFSLLNFPDRKGAKATEAVWFTRIELNQIMDIYGRMVSAGEWRDYAISPSDKVIVFSVYQRASERPQYQIIKEPKLATKQGAFRLIGPQGQVLKRGNDLPQLLKSLNTKLFKIINTP